MSENKQEQLLPVGSVVYLKGGTLKVVIISRGELVKKTIADEKPIYYDYFAGLYPQGYDNERNYYFNQENIEKVIFKGYQDEEEKRYLEVLSSARENNKESYEVETPSHVIFSLENEDDE
ncbi:MAG: DUF4176 domain-containing protein [Streptococcaceae bacterium]|jgi:hypothetical protein|nr:DUF4176 domain-containing protein [Streptococcaceae bacterium]